MSTCVIVFDPNSWDVPQKINVMSVPPPIDPSDLRTQPEIKSELLAKAVTVGSLPADLSTTDTLKITQVSKHLSYCGITKNIVTTFDSFSFSFSKPGWYQVASTEDIKVQILRGECGAGLKCFTAVVFRYGPTVMSMDTRGPVKGAGEYSLTHVTPNTNGIRHTPGSRPGEHTIVFPCGSKLNIVVVNTDGVANLYVNLFLVAGYTTPRGLCNIPRPFSPDNRLIGSDGKSYNRGKENEVDAFFDSWGIKDEDVLTNPDARASIPPIQQPGTVCKFPANPPPKPEIPVPPPPTTTTTTTTTGTTTTSSSSTLDLSESTLSPTITYTLSSTTVTTSPSTTSTTSPYLPDPPPSGGYVPLPQPDSTCSESLLYSIIAVRRKISAHWSAFFLDIIHRHFQAVMNHLCAQRHMRWNIRAARDNSLYPRPRSNTPTKPPPNSRRIISWNINGLVSKRNDLREHIAEAKPLLLMLQETNLDTNAFRFTAPKYSFIQHPANGPGKRGIALGFLAVLPAREIEGVPGTLILAKVPGLTEQQVWTVGSIYLGKNDRQATFKLVERALELATRDHNRPIIIGGDWNAPHATLQRKVSSWGFGLHVVSFSGSKATFRGRTATARWSSIDHFVCNQAARTLLTSPRVNRQPYISDHWPIYASLLAVPPTPPDVFIPTFNPVRCKELAPTIFLCNQFSILANLPDDCDSDTATNRLLDIINPNTAFSSLSNLPLIDTPVPVQHRRLYRATTKKAICKAKNAYRAWLASRNSILSPQETIQGKYNQYILAEDIASRLTKQDDHLRWRSHCTRIDNLLAGGCAKQAWNAAKRMACASGHSCRSSNPIRNEAGVLQFQPISICNTLRSHYMRLAEAGDDHSLDPTHWETMPQPPQHIPPSSILSMDLPFSLQKLDHALGSMHPRKAPGDDGITTALMQAIAHDPKDHGTGDVNLDRPGALALLRVANTIFLSGVIPKVWRRQIADLNSHIAFIDISKAFDTVPIHALLFKLKCIGIPAITMNFLSALYSTSNARIRSGSLLSDPFPVQRGVRQGCPLSGLLFNVFINDVLDGVAPISVPGLSQEHQQRGLMFADDIAIIAPSHESLCTSMSTITDWATRWEMSFGVAKCGIMHVAPIPTPLSRL
ncbi:hypothetical protein BASA50_002143 [Batrachochytrium salamandrivorans]|uniref:Reverse transcriptase domain-containing protein n=1 Tax=Batrachochytrium salamandrivorans TaxID=1357716 RepID=A0ABQ8FM11_9FUNG|nr:hypothetical protein BASA50_002143 [Batrachochytrium salamandrivorans]